MNREEFLKDLKKYWVENSIPNITEVNARFLRDLIKIKKAKSLLEIWTANWFSTINFWIELEKNWWKLISIEFSPNSHNQALENIKKVNLEKTVKLILWNALDEIPKIQETFDFIFIDWMKKRTVNFLKLVREKVDIWWIIIIDDVIKFKEKMIWLYEYLEENNIIYNTIPIDIDDWIIMIIK